jgi:3-oxoacyl-[acyl-carrier protein] reductase
MLNCLRSPLALENEISALRIQNGRVAGLCADASDFTQATALLERTRQTFGDVDILINNAGVDWFGLFQDMEPSAWENVMRTNFFSVLNLCRLIIPNMVARKKGVIVNISSVWGAAGASCEAVYAASKGAVNAFTKSLAKELGSCGVRVNAIACGAIRTRMNDRLTADETNALCCDIPAARFGTPEEVAELAYFLASDQAAYLTGQIIGLDGGWI